MRHREWPMFVLFLEKDVSGCWTWVPVAPGSGWAAEERDDAKSLFDVDGAEPVDRACARGWHGRYDVGILSS